MFSPAWLTISHVCSLNFQTLPMSPKGLKSCITFYTLSATYPMLRTCDQRYVPIGIISPFILIYILWSWISLKLCPLGTGIVETTKKLFVEPNQYEGQGTMD